MSKRNNSLPVINISLIARRGGIEVLLPVISKNLIRDNSAYIIYAPNKNSADVYHETQVQRTYGGKGILEAIVFLYKFLQKNKTSIVHLYNVGPVFLLVARLARCKHLVYSIHGTVYWQNTREKVLFKTLWYFALKQRLLITSNSNYSRVIFQNQVSRKAKPLLLYNPIDASKFQFVEKQDKSDGFTIIYTGRLVNGKNLFRWLEVAKHILDLFPKTRFRIFGEGPLKNDLQVHAEKLGLEAHLYFEGFISEIQKAYQSADLMIFLSEYESFGNVVVESILCGTPVLASNIPSMTEIFENYPEFLVPLDDNLENIILSRIKSLHQLKVSAKKAAQEFRTRFSLEQHIEKLEKIYDTI